MSPNGKPKGYFQFLLCLDCETTGLIFGNLDPTYNPKTKETHQAISWGFVVADAATLKPIDELYLEIKWDGVSNWTEGAYKIHGLSKKHLAEHGMTSEDAAIEFHQFVSKYWSPDNTICTLGHNHVSFDLWFLRRWLEPLKIMPKLGNRHVDMNSVGFVNLQTYTSDDLFKELGFEKRDKHNALSDIKLSLDSARRFRVLFNNLIQT